MPNKCSIINCGATLSRNRPNLTFHRLPQSKHKKRIWLEVIGKENIRSDCKNIYICSLHFHENSFNRTLDVIRLKDDAVPSPVLQQPLHEAALTARDDNVDAASQQNLELDQAYKELNRLQEKVYDQKKKIKCLNETIRRQKIKMATFKEVIKELKEKNLMTHENCILLEQCAGQKINNVLKLIQAIMMPVINIC